MTRTFRTGEKNKEWKVKIRTGDLRREESRRKEG